MPSFYCPELTSDLKQIVLSGDEIHHLSHVLRHKPGDRINLNSGKGFFGTGRILSIDKSKAVVELLEVSFSELPKPPYAIAFSLLRSKNDEWLVEKTTELGVTDLFPMTTQFSVRNPSGNTLNRFRHTALSAIKQCDNPYLPEIHPIHSLIETLQNIRSKGYTPVVTSELRPDCWLDDLLRDTPYCFLIGPEGGYSLEEFDILKQNGVIEIALSKLILRAETAAIAIAAQFNLISNN